MKRILTADTPAHRAALKLMRGVNVGNYLEFNPGHPAANQTYSRADFLLIKEEGFDHVRIPVAWHLGCGPGPGFGIAPDLFAKADTLVNMALESGLRVVIDFHHFDEMMSTPGAAKAKFYALWSQVAAHYADYPETLHFELLNEPNANATTAAVNSIYPEAIRQIRLTNPTRTILVGPGDWNGIGELKTGADSGLVLPDNDQNLIVTVHCYDPYYFTHQGAEWALPDTATTGVIFPGPPAEKLNPDPSITHDWVLLWFRDYNSKGSAVNPSSPFAFQSRLRSVRNWANYWGRPVIIGEWGCYEKADAVSRLKFIEAFRVSADALGLGWTMWDWKAGFHYIKGGQPEPKGMREAVFPPPRLTINDSEIRADAAVGKTYVLERADSLGVPLHWQSVSTQTLTTNILLFNIETNAPATSLYRVLWQKQQE